MQYLSDRIKALPVSATIKMAQMARELRSQGKDVIDLSLGQPDFDTPVHIKNAASQGLADGFTRYTPVPGLLTLREAICAKLKRDNGLTYTPNQIVVSNGAKQSVANLCLCMVNPGEEVILPAPYWVSYGAMVQLAEGKKVVIKTSIENDFKITPEQLEAHINDKTRLIIMSSPCNPTGSVYTREELAGIAKVLKKHPHVHIAFDEIYEYINFMDEHVSLAQFEEVYDQVITVNGMSKGFAMTGWRIGYIAAAEWIAKACAKMQGQFTSGACAFSQKGAEHALNSDLGPTHKMKAEFFKRRDLVIGWLKEIEGVKINVPEGAFYIFPDFSHFFGKKAGDTVINNPDDLAEYILNDALVSVVTGSPFGDDNCIRFSYAASEAELKEAISRLKTSLEKLN